MKTQQITTLNKKWPDLKMTNLEKASKQKFSKNSSKQELFDAINVLLLSAFSDLYSTKTNDPKIVSLINTILSYIYNSLVHYADNILNLQTNTLNIDKKFLTKNFNQTKLLEKLKNLCVDKKISVDKVKDQTISDDEFKDFCKNILQILKELLLESKQEHDKKLDDVLQQIKLLKSKLLSNDEGKKSSSSISEKTVNAKQKIQNTTSEAIKSSKDFIITNSVNTVKKTQNIIQKSILGCFSQIKEFGLKNDKQNFIMNATLFIHNKLQKSIHKSLDILRDTFLNVTDFLITTISKSLKRLGSYVQDIGEKFASMLADIPIIGLLFSYPVLIISKFLGSFIKFLSYPLQIINNLILKPIFGAIFGMLKIITNIALAPIKIIGKTLSKTFEIVKKIVDTTATILKKVFTAFLLSPAGWFVLSIAFGFIYNKWIKEYVDILKSDEEPNKNEHWFLWFVWKAADEINSIFKSDNEINIDTNTDNTEQKNPIIKTLKNIIEFFKNFHDTYNEYNGDQSKFLIALKTSLFGIEIGDAEKKTFFELILEKIFGENSDSDEIGNLSKNLDKILDLLIDAFNYFSNFNDKIKFEDEDKQKKFDEKMNSFKKIQREYVQNVANYEQKVANNAAIENFEKYSKILVNRIQQKTPVVQNVVENSESLNTDLPNTDVTDVGILNMIFSELNKISENSDRIKLFNQFIQDSIKKTGFNSTYEMFKNNFNETNSSFTQDFLKTIKDEKTTEDSFVKKYDGLNFDQTLLTKYFNIARNFNQNNVDEESKVSVIDTAFSIFENIFENTTKAKENELINIFPKFKQQMQLFQYLIDNKFSEDMKVGLLGKIKTFLTLDRFNDIFKIANPILRNLLIDTIDNVLAHLLPGDNGVTFDDLFKSVNSEAVKTNLDKSNPTSEQYKQLIELKLKQLRDNNIDTTEFEKLSSADEKLALALADSLLKLKLARSEKNRNILEELDEQLANSPEAQKLKETINSMNLSIPETETVVEVANKENDALQDSEDTNLEETADTGGTGS